MSNIVDIFKNALFNRNDVKQAADKLDAGKEVSVNMFSNRFSYNDDNEANLDKDWKPETDIERKTLSPEGYFRPDEKKEQKEQLINGILKSALSSAKKENPNATESELNNIANKEANEVFDENYQEKEISIPSTALETINYNPKTELLRVRFANGSKTYDYPAVPLELVQALLKAESKGEFFLKNIHDQYSIYGSDHSMKSGKQQSAVKKYIKSYLKNNNNNWKKAVSKR